MKVCGEAAGRYPSNYNAWSHRIWVLQNMAQGNLKVLHDELSSMKLWVSMHVSDHSGFHYRQFLLKALVGELSQAADWASPRPSADPRRAHQPNGEVAAPHNGQRDRQRDRRRGPAEGRRAEAVRGGDRALHRPDRVPGTPCGTVRQLWCHRRHVFFLWHHWRSELSQTGGCRGDESPGRSPSALWGRGQEPGGRGQERPGDGRGWAVVGGGWGRGVGVGRGRGLHTGQQAAEEGPPPARPPALHSEYSFVAKTLSGCRSPSRTASPPPTGSGWTP
ncbi:hypothetical protein ANANG_G00197540 [Anguilla anguilla]|uniref:Protein prenyltransferase alpha subunit repeat containing 1 n=1 Tax=Anguilla anguilla TaxID=7936 RepID=A0A9D3M298_ANGAN|nr:hypothetical protein ANANG_G00197540 [Anguilla anguilla]